MFFRGFLPKVARTAFAAPNLELGATTLVRVLLEWDSA